MAKFRSVIPAINTTDKFFVAWEQNQSKITIIEVTKVSNSGRVLDRYTPDPKELNIIYNFLNKVSKTS